MPVFLTKEFQKNLASLSRLFAARANRRYQFNKRSQLLIRAHNGTVSVTAMRIAVQLSAIIISPKNPNVLWLLGPLATGVPKAKQPIPMAERLRQTLASD